MQKKDKIERNKETVLMLAQSALSETMLYDQTHNNTQIFDQFVFVDPNDDQIFIYMRLLSTKYEGKACLKEICAIRVNPSDLVASIANGNYSQYQTIELENKYAQRALKIYHYFIQCFTIRGNDIEFFKEDGENDDKRAIQVELV